MYSLVNQQGGGKNFSKFLSKESIKPWYDLVQQVIGT